MQHESDRPRNSKPRSSDDDDIRAGIPSPYVLITPTEDFDTRQIERASTPLHGRPSVAVRSWSRTRDRRCFFQLMSSSSGAVEDPYSRAFGDVPRNYESWSSDEDDSRAVTPSPNFNIAPKGGSRRELLAADLVISNHGQVTRTTPQLEPPLLSTTPHEREDACQVIYSQFGLAIHQNDHQARRRFVKWAQNEIAVVPDFHKRILFSDEAHFWLNGYVNKQNCRIWSEANPQVYVETPLHPEKLTGALYVLVESFKNDEGHNVTVNGDRYRAMITNFFIPELNNHDVQELWFQQDGATCHTARVTID
ncbi:putative DD41D transposase [Trichonephila clavipes]|nr:putative DD41D transposase [Trichonephila clavipes]